MPRPTSATVAPPVRLTRQQLRTLAHPLRSRLLGALRLDGPATATTLAHALDTNTGATSYHLRQLADVGLVVEEESRGGKQRWWRAAHESHSFMSVDHDDDPDALAAAEWLEAQGLRQMSEEAEHWMRASASYPRRWRSAAVMSDYRLVLTAERLRALNDELHDVVQRYLRESGPDGDAGGEQVRVFLYGFPRAAEAS